MDIPHNASTPISEDELATALDVLRKAGQLDPSHPPARVLQAGVSKMFQEVKKTRRKAAKEKRRQENAEVSAATATANPRRVEDDTNGLLIALAGQEPVSLGVGAVATPHGFVGKLRRAHNLRLQTVLHACRQFPTSTVPEVRTGQSCAPHSAR